MVKALQFLPRLSDYLRTARYAKAGQHRRDGDVWPCGPSAEDTLYHCKALMVQDLARFWAIFATGSGLKRWRERNVSLALAAQGIAHPDATQLAYTRQVVKRTLRPTQAIIDDYTKTFLIGRDPGFGMEEVMRLATGYKRHLERQQRRQDRMRKSRPARER